VYVPAWRSTVALVLPPVTSSVPSPLTPFPSIFTSCGSEESFVKSIVTEPAVASTEVSSNLSAPLGSAEIWTVEPPPPPPPLVVAPPPEVVAASSLPPPHAAKARAKAASTITSAEARFVMALPPPEIGSL
jgi:hypothetical protein